MTLSTDRGALHTVCESANRLAGSPLKSRPKTGHHK